MQQKQHQSDAFEVRKKSYSIVPGTLTGGSAGTGFSAGAGANA